jgi:hypothetical protein
MSPSVHVVLCIDADPDRPDYGGTRYDSLDKLTWKYLSELNSKIEKLQSNVSKAFDAKLLFTWFLRADSQIKLIYDDAAWSLKEFEPVWKEAAARGDELAWHPHAWRWSDTFNCWYNEITDDDYILNSYDEGFEAFKETMRVEPAACRTGINFHSNRTMAKLNDLGVKVDLSGQAGLDYSYSRPEEGAFLKEGFWWARTPPEPYHPSREDYQSPSTNGRSLAILEIPMTVWNKKPSSIAFWRGLVPISTIGDYGLVRPIMRGWFTADVWGDPYRFKLALSEVFRRAEEKGTAHYGSSLHPDDLTEVAYRRFNQNLDYLIRTAQSRKIELNFATASQAYDRFK